VEEPAGRWPWSTTPARPAPGRGGRLLEAGIVPVT
jgi:hypothetical protein